MEKPSEAIRLEMAKAQKELFDRREGRWVYAEDGNTRVREISTREAMIEVDSIMKWLYPEYYPLVEANKD